MEGRSLMVYQAPKVVSVEIAPTFERFSSFVLDNQSQITPRVFAEEFGKIQRHYMIEKQRDVFCSEADGLAAKLVEQKNNDFAGIIMSALCKLTEFMPNQLEKFAKKGYEIAKANGDPVHMMARLNDLRKVYYRRPEKLYQYIQVLYKQEKCLKELTNHYETLSETHKTVTRRLAPKKDYEQMLAHVQTEIGKLTKKKHPLDAQSKLLSARAVFDARGNKQNVEYIDMLLREIENSIPQA